jgi:hypothetical protein
MMFLATTARSRLRQRYAVRVVSGEQPPELTGKSLGRVRPAQPEDVPQRQRPPPQAQPNKQPNQQGRPKQQQQWHSQPRHNTLLLSGADVSRARTLSIKGQRSIVGIVQLM